MPMEGAAGTAAAAAVRIGHLCMGGEMCGVRGGSAVLIALYDFSESVVISEAMICVVGTVHCRVFVQFTHQKNTIN